MGAIVEAGKKAVGVEFPGTKSCNVKPYVALG